MPWAKLDDGFYLNPKVVALSDGAFRLYVQGLNYSCDQLTDGVIQAPMLGMLLSAVSPATAKKRAGELVGAGLWHPVEGGWEINDFAEYQMSSATVAAKRDRNELTKLYKNKPLRERIQARDRDRCRFCAREVSWTDRVSERAATYDHLTPGAGNSLENVVVACKGCNSKKGERTVEELAEIGMVLRPPPPLPGSNSEATTEQLPEAASDLLGADVPEPEPEPEPEPDTSGFSDVGENGIRGVWGDLPIPNDINPEVWAVGCKLAAERHAEGYPVRNPGGFARSIVEEDRDRIRAELARSKPIDPVFSSLLNGIASSIEEAS